MSDEHEFNIVLSSKKCIVCDNNNSILNLSVLYSECEHLLEIHQRYMEQLDTLLTEMLFNPSDPPYTIVGADTNCLRKLCEDHILCTKCREIMKAIHNIRVLYTKKRLSAKDIEERDNNLRYIKMYRPTLTDFYTKDADILTAFKEMVDAYITFKRNAIAEKLANARNDIEPTITGQLYSLQSKWDRATSTTIPGKQYHCNEEE